MHTTVKKLFVKAQPFKSWAFIIWALALCNLSVFSLIDSSFQAVVLTSLIIALIPLHLNPWRRICALVLSAALLFFGPSSTVVITPLALIIAGLAESFVLSAVLLFALGLLLPQVQSINLSIFGWIPLSSLTFIILPTLASSAMLSSQLTKPQKIKLILAAACLAMVVALGSAEWLGASFISNPYLRIFLSILPLAAIFFASQKARQLKTNNFKPFLMSLVIGCCAASLLHQEKIKAIVFDESHGHWETVNASFKPSDFGRNANYTYSQLFAYAKSIKPESYAYEKEGAPLPPKDSLFIIKMPSASLSDEFSKRLSLWVNDGGRLLVVADHTDLYDTTQNINRLLTTTFSTKINADAAYDSEGMPNHPIGFFGNILLGKINSNNHTFLWQTGSSFNYIPLNTIELASFGLSFVEPGDYSRQNRFGTFVPSIRNKFIQHSSVVAFSSGKGAVSIILDSTPWSNFSIFIEQYKHLFKNIVSTLEMPYQLKLLGVLGYCLIIIGVIFPIIPTRVSYPLSGFILGTSMAIAIQLGLHSLSKMEYGQDFGLKVALGEESKIEFLKQLVKPGEQNFSRIISAMGKYSLMPISGAPGDNPSSLSDSKQWLFISPDANQLPDYRELVNFLSSGGNLTVIFSKHQAVSKDIVEWLNSFSIVTKNNIGLKVSDTSKSLSGSYLNGRTPALGREINVVTIAKPTSLFNSLEFDELMQTFSLRPTKVPRTSGLLNISFSADQFSDDAIGDVWEGVDPSSIGELREQQLAAVILGGDRPNQYPKTLIAPTPTKAAVLKQYLVLQDGETKIFGVLPFRHSQDPVEIKFQKLRALAEGFVSTSCPAVTRITKCNARLIDSNYVEWIVSWESDNLGKVSKIELLHDRRMAGLSSSWNVIFGR